MRNVSTKTSVDELIHVLRYKRTLPTRMEAIWQLTRIGGSRAVKALSAVLSYKEVALRMEAAIALGKLESDVEPSLRLKASTVLTSVRHSHDLRALGQALRNSGYLQEVVTEVLVPMSVEQILQVLSGVLWRPWGRTRYVDVQAILVSALQTLGQIRGLEVVEAALNHKIEVIRLSAAKALAKVGDRGSLPVLRFRAKRFFEAGKVKDACRQAIKEIEKATEHLKDLPIAASSPTPALTDLPIPATEPQFDTETLPRAAAAPSETSAGSGDGVIGWLRRMRRLRR